MAMLGERLSADATTLSRLAAAEGLDRRVAEGIIEQVGAAVSRWSEFADQFRIPTVPASAEDHALKPISAERR